MEGRTTAAPLSHAAGGADPAAPNRRKSQFSAVIYVMQTAGRVANDLTEQKMPCNVDVIGLGAGVVDRLMERHYDVSGINVADKASGSKRFANLRAEGYWRLRERFEWGQIMIPDDDELISELTSLKYKIVKSNARFA